MSRFAARRVAIIGLGLIGGSLARALRSEADVDHIVGCVRKPGDVALALELGLADTATTDVVAAVTAADVVVVAVGVDAMAGVFAQLHGALAVDAVVTDVGSTKGSVIAAARAAFDADELARFVPGHPISGTENSGLRASVDGLFANRRTILTPDPATRADAVARIEALWLGVGAEVTTMAAAHHDEVLAATSHLPHVVAFALVDTLADMSQRSEIFAYAAGGFADFTRIASSDPVLWRNIMFANRDAVVPALTQYIAKLDGLRAALLAPDRQQVMDCFERAKQARDRFTRTTAVATEK